MARLTDDDFARLRSELDQDSGLVLGGVRRANDMLQNGTAQAWLAAGDNLSEKVIAALDTGDEDRAHDLARRIVALPVIDGDVRAGTMAVDLVLSNEVLDPDFEDRETQGLLDLPLRLLPDLDPPVADELRHVLAAFTEYDLPAAMVRRISAVTSLDRRLDPPFAGVPEEALPAAVVGVLRLVLRLRSDPA